MLRPASPLTLLLTCSLVPFSLSLPSSPSALGSPPRSPLLKGFHLSSSDLAASAGKHAHSHGAPAMYNPLSHALAAASEKLDKPHSGSLSSPHSPDGVSLISSADSRIVYTGPDGPSSWLSLRSPSYLLRHTHSLDLALSPTTPTNKLLSPTAARATLTFTGTGVEWYGGRSPSHGRASVLLDGKEVALVDAYSPGFKSSQRLWSIKGIPFGMHEVAVVPLGRGQRRSRGVLVDVEAFGVVGLGGGKNRVAWEGPDVGGELGRELEEAGEFGEEEEEEVQMFARSWERRER